MDPRADDNPYVSPDGHHILDIRYCVLLLCMLHTLSVVILHFKFGDLYPILAICVVVSALAGQRATRFLCHDSTARSMQLPWQGGSQLRVLSADGEIGVHDTVGDYKRISDEVMTISGVVSLGLLADVATDVAICGGADTQHFTKQELADATAQPASSSATSDEKPDGR